MIYEEILLYHFPEFRAKYDDNIKNSKSVIQHILKGENAKIVIYIFKNFFFLNIDRPRGWWWFSCLRLYNIKIINKKKKYNHIRFYIVSDNKNYISSSHQI